MGALQPWHIIVIVVAFVILFGSKKLPDAARGLGRSMRIFKSEVNEMHNEHAASEASTSADTKGELPTGQTGSNATGPQQPEQIHHRHAT